MFVKKNVIKITAQKIMIPKDVEKNVEKLERSVVISA
jgi:hypothetical protein